MLSIGGASTNIPDTSADFHQSPKLATDFTTFQNNFVHSYQEFVTSHGFEGIDINIEHGFNNPFVINVGNNDLVIPANHQLSIRK